MSEYIQCDYKDFFTYCTEEATLFYKESSGLTAFCNICGSDSSPDRITKHEYLILKKTLILQ